MARVSERFHDNMEMVFPVVLAGLMLVAGGTMIAWYLGLGI